MGEFGQRQRCDVNTSLHGVSHSSCAHSGLAYHPEASRSDLALQHSASPLSGRFRLTSLGSPSDHRSRNELVYGNIAKLL